MGCMTLDILAIDLQTMLAAPGIQDYFTSEAGALDWQYNVVHRGLAPLCP